MIQEHKSIRDDLLRFQKSLSSQPDLHSNSLLRKLLTVDVIHFAACLAVAVADDAKYETFIQQQGSKAQPLINLLQAVCSQNSNLP